MLELVDMPRTSPPKRPQDRQHWLEEREEQLERIAGLYERLERELTAVEARFQLNQPLPTRSLRRRKPR